MSGVETRQSWEGENKKQNAREAKQNRMVEGSPESGLHNGDKELESLPHQSLVQTTNVHYGKRSDLKSKLQQFL